ncbi:hypothetical protein BKA70DRAFT_1564436 [Coprinopsis sp. MPI-PUGE-AT-0042]|nr:hypothetical protein BKA70DRAFT_1564436 [Coprinopsis sp. MPI-PUGE-AT-0042]
MQATRLQHTRFSDVPDDILLVILEITARIYPRSLMRLVFSFKRIWDLYLDLPTTRRLTRLAVSALVGGYHKLARSFVLVEGVHFHLEELRKAEENEVGKNKELGGEGVDEGSDEDEKLREEERQDDMILEKYEVEILREMYRFHCALAKRARVKAVDRRKHLHQAYIEEARRYRPNDPPQPPALAWTSPRNARFYAPIDILRRKAQWCGIEVSREPYQRSIIFDDSDVEA